MQARPWIPTHRWPTNVPRLRGAGIRVASMLVGIMAIAAPARADWRDACETPDATWKFIDGDCPALRERAHLRQFRDAHSGQGCEYLGLTADRGTFVHYGIVAEPCRVIDELAIGVWVKASRPGMQLVASVVLPRTTNPHDGKPIRTVLRGSIYRDAGQWRQLTISQPGRLLRQQEASLRFQFGSSLDIREAYLDLIVLNAYGGQGDTDLWIDDLEVTGEVRVEAAGLASVNTPGAADLPSIHASGDQLLAGEQPIHLRIIEYNGEPLGWLKSIGFSCVRLPGPPTAELLDEAKEAGVWVIAHPAEQNPAWDSDRLFAWDTGNGLRVQDADTIMSLYRGPNHTGRRVPLTGSPAEPSRRFADLLEFVIIDLPTIGSGWELDEFGSQLRRRAAAAGITGPFFAGVPTEPPAVLESQWNALSPGRGQSPWLESDQLRLLAIHAATSGARGIVFHSRSRLDADSPRARLRARTVELINLDLQLLEPFLAGGRAAGRLDLGDRHLVGYGLETDRGHLMVACRRSDEQQFAVSAYAEQPVSVVVPAISSSASAYQLADTGVRQVVGHRIAGGLQVRLDEMGIWTSVVVSQEAVVMSRLVQTAMQGRQRRAELGVEVLSLSLGLVEEIRGSRPTNDRAHVRRIGDAAARLEQAARLLSTRDFRSVEVLIHQGMNDLAAVRRDWWEESARAFAGPVASPGCALFSSLPVHWALVDRLRGRAWPGNILPGGEMEDLRLLLDSGWTRDTIDSHSIVTDVQIASDHPRSGYASLKLQATANGFPLDATELDRPTVVIRSASVPVRKGQLAQIRGWAWVESPSGDAALQIRDSLGGAAIGERLATGERPGQQGEWRAWSLYRMADADGLLVLHFELEGFGEAWIDDVTVQLLDLHDRPRQDDDTVR